MHIIRGIAVAFSTYSKIPMPQFVWKEEDMRYSMCFFPWIGAVIGAISGDGFGCLRYWESVRLHLF